MKIKFCGAARQVTGSAHLIILESGYQILLDCGLYQGNDKDMKDFNEKFLFDPKDVDAMILSHAHIDHCGRIPKLVKDGFEGNIYCTHATKSLCSIMLVDSARIQERDAEFQNKIKKRKNRAKKLKEKDKKKPLYNVQDVQRALSQFIACGYDRWFTLPNRTKALFRDAGHILGSASVTMHIKEGGKTKKLGFTGDIGRVNRPILKDPLPMPEVDYLISESTYGDKNHKTTPQMSDSLLEVIKSTCLDKKGKLLIPAFSVGRTQEIVYKLDQWENEGILPRIPVYVDSPLAVNATIIYHSHPECFDADLNEYLVDDPNPFGFNNLTYVKSVEMSKGLNSNRDPAIIISASGMMNAGRIRHHLYNNIEDPKTTLLVVGYCAPNTTGGILRSGVEKLKLFGDWKDVNMDIEIMDSFSAHGDRDEMYQFMSNQKDLQKLFLVHGEEDTQFKFKKFLGKKGLRDVTVPDLGNIIEI